MTHLVELEDSDLADQLSILPDIFEYWERVKKFDPDACALADRHYSRRTPGSNQFMPPGQTIVLLGKNDYPAVFGWCRPHPDSGIKQMNNLDGWTCTIFRNEGAIKSSLLILDAEKAIPFYGCGKDGLMTYVWDTKVASSNPGYCFKRAGYKAHGRSADGKKTLLMKDYIECKEEGRSDGRV